jgi:hypothetical protein
MIPPLTGLSDMILEYKHNFVFMWPNLTITLKWGVTYSNAEFDFYQWQKQATLSSGVLHEFL